MSQQILSDLAGVFKGAQKVASEGFKLQNNYAKHYWANSSLKGLLKSDSCAEKTNFVGSKNAQELANEVIQRGSMVFEGLKAFTNQAIYQAPQSIEIKVEAEIFETIPETKIGQEKKEFLKIQPQKVESIPEDQPKTTETVKIVENIIKEQPKIKETTNIQRNKKISQTLSENAKQRKVPSTRIGRMVSFGSLAAGLGIGTVAELTRRTLGMNDPDAMNAFLTPANAERIVNTLCKVRGAALKIGQLMSIQDNDIIHPSLQAAFERVRQSADFMPSYQVEKVLNSELGSNWREKFADFDIKPFAAASIGQVHWGKLHDGTEVAVKIQYPGVAAGINSDIENLVSVLNLWNVFPEGLFIDKLVEVAKKELSWEVDYKREAECTKKFKELLQDYPSYLVPKVIDELSAQQVFTTELVEGVPVDKCADLDFETRCEMCRLIMKLCLNELFVFRYMQTDPNWSNFFFNKDTKQLVLLDFGATRKYDKEFMDQYIQVIKAAADRKPDVVLEMSQKMGFLTGYESKAMEQAHVDTVMILGEVFSDEGEFDFGRQNITKKVTKLVPTILYNRLCPPPEEIYSLNRKLSGVFLLCAKLKVKIACKPLFMDIYDNYEFGPEKV